MENNKNKTLPWALSLLIHATGAALILFAGFHFATPEGTVSDKTEFVAIDVAKPDLAPNPQRPPAPPAPPAPPKEDAVKEVPVEPPPPEPVVDEAPQEEMHKESPHVQESIADDTAPKADQDPGLEPEEHSQAQETATTESAPSTAEATPSTNVEPSAPAAPTAAEIGAVPQFGTPGTTLDESKLTEAFGNHKPSYPWMARLKREQGTVVLRAYINKDGLVEKAQVEQSSGSKLLDDESLRSYSRWKYQPGLTGWVLKPFKFSLK